MKTPIAIILLTLWSVTAWSDPIEDLSMKTYRSGWYPNFFHGQGPLTCPRTCDVWVQARAEGERSNNLVSQSSRAYVCKITRDPDIITKPINDPSSHWIYGNQFNNNTLCNVSNGSASTSHKHYMCLCVTPG